MDNTHFDIIVVGGGAAGYFFAINAAERIRGLNIAILEKQPAPLSKVRVSGGGRCNVTHACFEPKRLTAFYPRGAKELLPLFHRFNPTHMIAWLDRHGVELKKEDDGRMFPVSNSSQTIIDCFLHEAERLGITTKLSTAIKSIKPENGNWIVTTGDDRELTAEKLFVAPGSSQQVWDILSTLGHTIIPPVPSLFTFNCAGDFLKDLPGISVPNAEVRVAGLKLSSSGPLLITHTGLSGPAILKLSAWGARELAEAKYVFTIKINFTGDRHTDQIMDQLLNYKTEFPAKAATTHSCFELPLRLWQRMTDTAGIDPGQKWRDVSKAKLRALAEIITASVISVTGKSPNKEEFVTSGGINRKEIDWKRMESRLHKNLFFGGEVIDIDALTGGFNFQAAWTTAFIAAESAVEQT